MILAIADIFRWDIHFAQNLRPGDSFGLFYEEQYMDGEKVHDDNILATEFINEGTTYRAIRHSDANREASYYTPQGLSLRTAFQRTLVDFTRISLGFSVVRYHLLIHTMHAYKGVDYAAPSGTPVKIASDGKVVLKRLENPLW